MLIQHNLDAMRGLRYGQKLNNSMSKTLQKLSSGYRINSAADDAAGLAVSEKMRLFMTEYDRCTDNVKEGQNLAQTADAALQEVNDMLCRAKELCTRAANGTYSQIERDALQSELDELYTEMDRIFEGARFNTVHLFRHDSPTTITGHYEVVENAEPTDELVEWGKMDDLEDRYFNFAKPAKGASVTIPLDSTVNVNDAKSVIGKSFSVMDKTCLFEFTDGTSNTTLSSGSSGNFTGCDIYRIGVGNCATVQDAFDKAVDYMQANKNSMGYWNHTVSGEAMYLESAKVNGNEVTLTFEPVDMVQTIPLGGSSEDYFVKDADGEISNNLSIHSKDQLDLAEVDGAGNTNNKVEIAPGEKTVTFMAGRSDASVLTADEKETLTRNYLYFYGGSSPSTFSLHFALGSGSASSTVYLDSINTVGQLRSAIASEINALTASNGTKPYSAQVNGDGSVTVTQTSGSNRDYFYEVAQSGTTGGSGSGSGSGGSTTTTHTTTALDFTLRQTSQASGESRDAYEMTIPATLPDYFSLKIGNVTHTFYNGIPAGHSGLSSSSSSTSTFTNIQGKSVAEVCGIIKDRIASKFPDANVSLSGNTISMSNKYLGSDLNIDDQITKTTTSISFKQNDSGSGSGSGGGGTTVPAKHLLFSSSAYQYFEQNGVTVDVDLSVAMGGGAFDASRLAGSGFRYADVWYEFDDGDAATPQKRADSKLVDISSCTSYDDVKTKLTAAMQSGNPSWIKNFRITSAGTNSPVLTLTCDRSSGDSSLTFYDGYKGIDGIFTEEPTDTTVVEESFKTAGGENIGKPTATINFSKYNSSNFSELYGKGFRVTCATCAGEYINVMFCNDKTQLDLPPSFEIMDDSQTPPVPRIIHNLAVELKGMKSGEDIVKAIVQQLTPELDHYTEVAIGEPASVLNVMDKRMGDIEIAGKAYRAQVLSGVYTNFRYGHEEVFVPDPGESTVGDVTVDFRKVEIYAGSEPTKQIIDIHLPYLTLENLKLTDPASDLSTTEAAAETMGRVVNANNAISYARGTIGADFNRLEHAHESLSQAEVQMTDAYSRIRDADMAEEMTEKVRVSILQQAQQTVFMHSMQQPQQIISLLGA